jgi:hypothetical protein
MVRIGLIILLLINATSCSKAPALEAPCHDFGRYCSQQPIN